MQSKIKDLLNLIELVISDMEYIQTKTEDLLKEVKETEEILNKLRKFFGSPVAWHERKHGFLVFLIKNHLSGGTHNGYLVVPKEHPWWGVHYDDIPSGVHGGLTFSEQIDDLWVIGFDTNHAGDTSENWNFLRIISETYILANEAVKIWR